MNCTFCSVTAFNGALYRQRSILEVVSEFRSIREKRVLVVDDNLVGTRPAHIARAKDLFRALAAADLRKEWVAQATINFADDEELLTLAARAGCAGVFIGFESPTPEGLTEIGKRFNLLRGRDLAASVARIQRHHILVVGSFIIGLDVDTAGIGRRTAEAARQYGVDLLNALFLTPLPGTRLWDQMTAEGRLLLDDFPRDWQVLHADLPGRPLQAPVGGAGRRGDAGVRSPLLRVAANPRPPVEERVATPPAAHQPVRQPVVQAKHATEPHRLRRVEPHVCGAARRARDEGSRRARGLSTPDRTVPGHPSRAGGVVNRRRDRVQSCRTTLRSELLTVRPPSTVIKPSFLNRFMKKFTRDRVVPTISASVCCEIFGMTRCGTCSSP